jgi:hypothetical protein
VFRYNVGTNLFVAADTVTLDSSEGYATLLIPFPGKLLAATRGTAKSMVFMTIPVVTTTSTTTTTTTAVRSEAKSFVREFFALQATAPSPRNTKNTLIECSASALAS